MPRLREKCAICATKTSSRFYPIKSEKIEDLKTCFNEIFSRETSKICASCYRQFNRWTANGKLGAHGNIVKSRGLKSSKNTRDDFLNPVQPSCNLLGLPTEILALVMFYLPPRDVCTMSTTCHQLRKFCQSDYIWKQRYFQDFGIEPCYKECTLPFRTLYELTYASTRKAKAACYNMQSELSLLRDCQEQTQMKLTETMTQLQSRTTVAQRLHTDLLRLQDNSEDTPVNGLQDAIFHNVAKKKLNKSKDGFIFANAQKGKPIKLMHIPASQKGSAVVSSSTLRSRSKIVEAVTQSLATPPTTNEDANLTTQQASLIKRNKDHFLESAKKAGLKIITKFTLKEVAQIKAHMPMEMLRMLKRSFTDILGYDIFGPERSLRKYIQDLEFQHECGTFKTEEGVMVSFVRVTDVADVVCRVVTELSDSLELTDHQNIDPSVLSLLVTGDKGSASTKLLLQVMNSKVQHSIKNAKLLAIFEGAKDNRECIETVFGPVIKQLEDLEDNFKEMDVNVVVKNNVSSRVSDENDGDVIEVNGSAKWPVQLTQLDSTNTAHSTDCKLCSRKKVPLDKTSPPPEDPAREQHHQYKTCKVRYGGDWNFLAALLGLTGPNGAHFCNYCLCKLDDVIKGTPHTPTPLSKYAVTAPKAFKARTFTEMRSSSQKYQQEGAKKKDVKNFNNCEQDPLYGQAAGEVLDKTSCMPLHITLGIGHQMLQIIEKIAVEEDNQVKASQGMPTEKMKGLVEKRNKVANEVDELTKELREKEQVMEDYKEICDAHDNENAAFLAKVGRRYKIPSTANPAVKAARAKARQLKGHLTMAEKDYKTVKRLVEDKESALKDVMDTITKERGPFQKNLQQALEDMHLKRQVYHKGALIGNDVQKMLQKSNIMRIARTLKPIKIEVHGRGIKTFGSASNVSKIITMLNKFSQCHALFAPSHALCKHEVALLQVRCASFGCWFPKTFPDENLKRKFHVLTYEVPQKAKLLFSVGMEAEHCSESIHPVVNSLNRRYATTQNVCDRLALITKAQWLQSNATMIDYRKPNARQILQNEERDP